MNDQAKLNKDRRNYLFLVIGIIGIIFIQFFDFYDSDRAILEESSPILNFKFNSRSIFILISTIILFMGIVPSKYPKIDLFDNTNLIFRLPVLGKSDISKLSLLGIYCASFVFFITALSSQRIFNWLSFEDNILEWGSALFLFIASFIFFISWINSFKKKAIPRITKVLLSIFSLLFFLIGMEEVSWFQRVIGFETPENFSMNVQDEFNLHNFSTSIVENAYYTGSFVLLVFIPFISLLFPKYLINDNWKLLIPRTFLIVIGSAAFSYNYDMWDINFTQLTFYSSIIILIMLSKFELSKFNKRLLYGIIGFLIIQQIIFLINPGIILPGARNWTFTEYKEFFIPLAFCTYSLDVYFQLKRKSENIE